MSDYDDINTRTDYNDRIDFLADCVREEFAEDPEDPDDLTEIIESIADSEVTYTTDCVAILYHSPSQPSDWSALVSDESSWEEVVQAMAYDVLRQDLYRRMG